MSIKHDLVQNIHPTLPFIVTIACNKHLTNQLEQTSFHDQMTRPAHKSRRLVPKTKDVRTIPLDLQRHPVDLQSNSGSLHLLILVQNMEQQVHPHLPLHYTYTRVASRNCYVPQHSFKTSQHLLPGIRVDTPTRPVQEAIEMRAIGHHRSLHATSFSVVGPTALFSRSDKSLLIRFTGSRSTCATLLKWSLSRLLSFV